MSGGILAIIVALPIFVGGCSGGPPKNTEQRATTGEDVGNCIAIDWTADDISEDYYPWQATYDSTGTLMGMSAPWTLSVGPPGPIVEVAPPIASPPYQQGIDWTIRLNTSTGNCELVFYKAAPYTVRVGGSNIFVAGAAAAALNDGFPIRFRRARVDASIVPANVDLSLYSDAAPGLIALGGFAVPLGKFSLPQPRMEVNDAAAAVTAINNRSQALGRPIVVAFLAHGNVGLVALKNEDITPANGKAKFMGARDKVTHQRQISCLAGTPATPQVLEQIADGLSGAQVATVGGYDAVIVASPFGFFTTGTYHEYHGE